MNKFLVGAAAIIAFSAPTTASAAILSEDFESFPGWASNWFGVNSNASSCYDSGAPTANRGNNPDGIWISTTGQGCNSSAVNIVFNSAFASSLTSLSMDVAGYSASTLKFFDKDGATLLSQAITLTYGAYTDPGAYVNYGVTSSNGIGGFSFDGYAAGNTSIDNLLAKTGTGAVPEPAAWAMMLAGFGLVGASMRRREKVSVTFA